MTNAALTSSGGGVTVWRRVWCGGGGGGRPAMVARLAAMATHASLRSRPFASRWPAPAQPRAESGTAAHSEQPAAGSRGGRPRPTTTEVDRPTRRYAQWAGQAAGGRTDEQVSARHEAASRADQAAGARRSAWTAAGQHSALRAHATCSKRKGGNPTARYERRLSSDPAGSSSPSTPGPSQVAGDGHGA